MRRLIREEVPDAVEEWKWMGTPVWSHDGMICTGETYKTVVKLTFAKGAALKDPARLFNSSLDGNVRRAIDIHEGQVVDESAFKALVREAIALNGAGRSKPSGEARSSMEAPSSSRAKSATRTKPAAKAKPRAKARPGAEAKPRAKGKLGAKPKPRGRK